MADSLFVHPSALCESESVGQGTHIWAFAHVMRGAVVGCDCNIGEGVFIESGAVIGKRVTIKNHVMVWDGVQIADEAFIGPAATFTNDLRPRSPRMNAVSNRYKKRENWRLLTRVGRGASLGAAVVVLPGLTIGEFSMVGAGAIVTRDVVAHELVVGNPAKHLGWVCFCGSRLNQDSTCLCCGTTVSIRKLPT